MGLRVNGSFTSFFMDNSVLKALGGTKQGRSTLDQGPTVGCQTSRRVRTSGWGQTGEEYGSPSGM